jgi:hypothetical protein
MLSFDAERFWGRQALLLYAGLSSEHASKRCAVAQVPPFYPVPPWAPKYHRNGRAFGMTGRMYIKSTESPLAKHAAVV